MKKKVLLSVSAAELAFIERFFIKSYNYTINHIIALHADGKMPYNPAKGKLDATIRNFSVDLSDANLAYAVSKFVASSSYTIRLIINSAVRHYENFEDDSRHNNIPDADENE